MGKGRRLIELGPGKEFDLIRRFLERGTTLPDGVVVGPGDDAAVLEGGWVLSVDLSIEGVHFRRDWLTDREIGARAAAAALSDLAAMAARPVGVLVSLAVPKENGANPVEVEAGVREAAEGVGAAVIGGDVSGSPGPLVVDVVVVGRTARPVLRTGARPGGEVWVSGTLGASAGAVRLWEAGSVPPGPLRDAFVRPQPRCALAVALAEAGVLDALIDLSDGLGGDAGHLAAASGVRILLEEERIPVAPAVTVAFGPDVALELALGGGEDYELCFVAQPGALDPTLVRDRFGVELTRVGRVTEGEGVWIEDASGAVGRWRHGGFDHWR